MNNFLSKTLYIRYSTNELEILEAKEKYYYVYLKKDNRYMYKRGRLSDAAFYNFEDLQNVIKKTVIKVQLLDIVGYLFIIIIPFLMIKIVNRVMADYSSINGLHIGVGFLFLLLNVFLHEMAHYFIMMLYGENAKYPKIKFEKGILKIHTDTTSSYLLPPYKRVIVYMAGISINVLNCFIACCLGISGNIVIFSLALIFINIVPSSIYKNDIMQVIDIFNR